MRYDCKPIKETIEDDLKHDVMHALEVDQHGTLYCMTERKVEDKQDQYVAHISCSLCGTFPSAGEWQYREWEGITSPICDDCHEERWEIINTTPEKGAVESFNERVAQVVAHYQKQLDEQMAKEHQRWLNSPIRKIMQQKRDVR